MLRFIQTENVMAKEVVRRSRRASGSRGHGTRRGWVRKNVVMDQRKLDVARRALGVDTETEASTRHSTPSHSVRSLQRGSRLFAGAAVSTMSSRAAGEREIPLDTNIFIDGFRSEEAQAEIFTFLK